MKFFWQICLCLFAGLPQLLAEPPVYVGSKNYTESVILGEVLKELAAQTHRAMPLEHRASLGGTQILWHALQSGEVDIYLEYTGTIKAELLHDETLETLPKLKSALAAKGLGISMPLGFNNSYAFGMTRTRAEALGIRKISDLQNHPDLKFGFSQEFIDRSEGWKSIKQKYNLTPQEVTTLDHELAYRALHEGAIDVNDLYTTDPEIRRYDLIPLEDDLQFFPQYLAVYLYRLDLLKKWPTLLADLRLLEHHLDNPTVIGLNSKTNIDKLPESDVAKSFVDTVILGQKPSSSEGTSLKQKITDWFWERFLHDSRNHVELIALPLSLNILIGIPLGVIAARYRRFREWILGICGTIQTIPALALLVFMIPVLGIGYLPAVMTLFLYGLLPIVRSTCTGLVDIPRHIPESAEALGIPYWMRLIKIDLPMASRSILSGVTTSAVISVGTATLGALVGAGGFGEPILIGIRRDDIYLILQGAIPAAGLAILIQMVFRNLEKRLIPKGLRLSQGKN